MVLIHTASRSTGCGQLSNKHWLAEIQKCAICSPPPRGRTRENQSGRSGVRPKPLRVPEPAGAEGKQQTGS